MSEIAQMPPSIRQNYKPFQIDGPANVLVLSDVHLPYHDVRTVQLAIDTAAKRRDLTVFLNGDILDSHEISRFDRDPRKPRYQEEIGVAKGFFAYLRQRLPKARIVFKEGDHEERLQRYVMRNAPALFGLKAVTLPLLLKLKSAGVEFVADKRVVRLGSLNAIHGHEFPGGTNNPVNPARGLFLRAKTVAMCSHFHQTSEHHEPTIEGKPKGCWSTGCACQLNPEYAPLNKWNHGFAMVEIGRAGAFSVRNLRVMGGKIV